MTSRSRSANAFRRGAADAEEARSAPVSARPANNAWSRSAQAGLTDRLHEARQEAEQARQAIYEGILEGTVPLRVPTDLIEDAVGSDRFGGEEPNDPTDAGDSARSAAEDAEEAGLAALRENIRARGQRMPIRIRPLDSAWRPDPTNPRDLGDQRFAVQSGRRRLQVCRELGIDVLAGLSFVPAGMERLDDLHERFFENTVRKRLTAFERLLSIGLIANETAGATQAQMAEILGVSTASLSRGLAVLMYREALTANLDPAHATRAEIDGALKAIRTAERSDDPEARRSRERRARSRASKTLPFRSRELPIGMLRLHERRDGRRVLTLEGAMLDDARIMQIVQMFERL